MNRKEELEPIIASLRLDVEKLGLKISLVKNCFDNSYISGLKQKLEDLERYTSEYSAIEQKEKE